MRDTLQVYVCDQQRRLISDTAHSILTPHLQDLWAWRRLLQAFHLWFRQEFTLLLTYIRVVTSAKKDTQSATSWGPWNYPPSFSPRLSFCQMALSDLSFQEEWCCRNTLLPETVQGACFWPGAPNSSSLVVWTPDTHEDDLRDAFLNIKTPFQGILIQLVWASSWHWYFLILPRLFHGQPGLRVTGPCPLLPPSIDTHIPTVWYPKLLENARNEGSVSPLLEHFLFPVFDLPQVSLLQKHFT